MPPYVSTIIFLPVIPVSDCGPPTTNLPVGLTKQSFLKLNFFNSFFGIFGIITDSIISSFAQLARFPVLLSTESSVCWVEITILSTATGLPSIYFTVTCDLPSGPIYFSIFFFLTSASRMVNS